MPIRMALFMGSPKAEGDTATGTIRANEVLAGTTCTAEPF